jgi:DNA adenine methylase
MRYVGGKYRIAKPLAAYLESVRQSRPFIEPFCGGANITAVMSGQRLAIDVCEDIIHLWSAVSDGWEPPTQVSESEYAEAKKMQPCALRGFIGFGCSFGGKFFGGYARSGTRNYALNAHNAIMKKAPQLKNVQFTCNSYDRLTPEGCLVYCDPPYANTTQGYASKHFNSVNFWHTMREWAKRNTVLVSEYVAPDFAKEVWRIDTKTDMHCANGKQPRIERLFQVYSTI